LAKFTVLKRHPLQVHPILKQSFAMIDQEIGAHSFSADEYAIVRRVIHSTADFEFKQLIRFSPGVIEIASSMLTAGTSIITDVTMVKQGIVSLVEQTFQNVIVSAVELAETADPGKTRTETGLLMALERYPKAIVVIGNAPTALLALCDRIQADPQPMVVIGAPVGFISVLESKTTLMNMPVPQIRVDGRKGGSAAAAAIVNALLVLAWEKADL
jgi:precorrin-8X/cobalt-precorrin-8 methylmutase